MGLHVGGKITALAVVIFALITAFSEPMGEPPQPVGLAIDPVVTVSSATEETVVRGGVVHGPIANPLFEFRATAYNSLEDQTYGDPHITATGTRTRFGIVAVSRDLLGAELPYGSLIRLRDMGSFSNGSGAGKFQAVLDGQAIFVVEDTMHARKRQQLDVWFEEYSTAVDWGVRRLQVELIRYGRHGAEIMPVADSGFDTSPVLLASR